MSKKLSKCKGVAKKKSPSYEYYTVTTLVVNFQSKEYVVDLGFAGGHDKASVPGKTYPKLDRIQIEDVRLKGKTIFPSEDLIDYIRNYVSNNPLLTRNVVVKELAVLVPEKPKTTINNQPQK